MQIFLNLFSNITFWSILGYIVIFIAKMVEVTLATIRAVLIQRGEKVRGAIIGFFEVFIWVMVVGQVLGTITEDPLKVVVYCLAFSCGNYLGATIEGKLAIGNASLQVIVGEDIKDVLTSELRENCFGVTTLEGHGKNGIVDVLLIFVKRKRVKEAINIIHGFSPDAVITVNDVRQLRNGYVRK